MARCLLALGSNLGDRCEILSRAASEIVRLPKCRLLRRSLWHETEPIGGPAGQGAFLNGCLLLETQLEPGVLCRALLEIEQQLGRQRRIRWDARSIDIDLLLYDQLQLETEELTLPHPRMSFRRFVLKPACDIAGSMIHPPSGWTLAQLLRYLEDSPRYVAVVAAEPASAHRLAIELCQILGSPMLERLNPTPRAGPDSQPPEAVELDSEQSEVLQISRWLQVPELAARLSHLAEPELPPVVSNIWSERALGGQVRPALVVAWDTLAGGPAHEILKETLDRPGHGPMARIRGDDFSAVLAEAVAAVRAVWPAVSCE